MNKRSFNTLGLLAVLALLLSGGNIGVLAQGPEPPQPPRPPIRRNPPYKPPYGSSFNPEEPFRPPSLDLRTTAQVESPTVALGDPGLSFRYVETLGVTEEAYPADTEHFNFPDGIFIDNMDNLYVTERHGARVIKFNANGDHLLTLGKAGYRVALDDSFYEPADVAVDGSGNIWVVDRATHRVVKYDPSGEYISQLGVTWEDGSDNDHFYNPRGVAFDSSDNIYVADTENHRVQVYDSNGVYLQTLGVTGVIGSDNDHFNYPTHVAFDGSGNLYVSDSYNHRIQIFDSSLVYSDTIGSGSCDVGNYDFCYPWRVEIDHSENVYVADVDNNRVQIFNSDFEYQATLGQTGVPGSDNDSFYNPQGVAVDSAGNIFVSDVSNHRIQKFNSSLVYQSTLGTTGVPYVTDEDHYNAPWGIAVTPDGSIYTIEHRGYRLIKLDADGSQQWTVGETGIFGDDNDHFGGFWNGPEGNISIDSTGRVYVPDTPNNRIQIFNSSGTLVGTLGTYGSGYYQFDYPTGIAISPINDDIYVADRWNHRVQVFNSNKIYKDTLGVTGVTGSDNGYFNLPYGVALDKSGNVYVVDTDNHRIQIFDSSHTYQRTIGVTGESGDDFGHFFYPHAVAIDREGRVFVASGWSNSRIQVFDDTGAYLTTIGGQWGSSTGEMNYPAGVAVDDEGNVYVTEFENHRIQKFSPGVPGWVQVNINGFGDRNNAIPSLEIFNGQMYAGSWYVGGGDAEVWRTDDGRSWDEVTPPWSSHVGAAFDIEPFGSHLYVGTGTDNSGEVWRTDGTTWEQVVSGGFGDSSNTGVNALATYDSAIYAATSNYSTGVEIWHSVTGDPGAWSQVNIDGFSGGATAQDITMEVFGSHLYVGLSRSDTAELWRWNGTNWSSVFTDSLGDPNNTSISSFAVFQGSLYIGLRNVVDGGHVWRSTDGLSWNPVITDGLGNTDNGRPYGLIKFEDHLYLVFCNLETGAEVWRSADGSQWVQVGENGWGDSKNGLADYVDKGAIAFNGNLYIGSHNFSSGAQIWQMLHQIYLPLIQR